MDGTTDKRKGRRTLRQLATAGLLGASLCVLSAAVLAAPSSSAAPQPDIQPTNPTKPLTGLEALKAQMNAMQAGLENLRRLRTFFDSANVNETAVLDRAQRLIKTLPQNENTGDAAWRIAAVASLTLSSGALADVSIDDAYRLTKGAVGWDLGPEGARTHTGFVPVSPKTLDDTGTVRAVSGPTALSDGIAALDGFQASIPNGLYRVVIVRDGAQDIDPQENPFGGEINVNGAPLNSQTGNVRDRVQLTAQGEKVASAAGTEIRRTAQGLAIEGWAIVENGQLNVSFEGLSTEHAITAIIAEPFDIEKLELNPSVMDTLAESLGDVETAAGPKTQSKPAGPRFGRVFGRSQSTPTGSAAAEGKSAKSGGKTAGRSAGRAASSSERFAAAKTRLAAAPQPTEETQPAEEEETQSPATSDDAPPFEERQILVKRSSGEGDDTPGLAVDLGSLLDDASLSGIFMCFTDPCDTLADFSVEPDLTPAAALLGNWLDDPENLSDAWIDLETVLATRDLGSEIATVYEFDIDSENWTDVELRVSAGSGLFVWLDGDFIFGGSQTESFTDDLDFEYIIDLPDLPGGKHYLQILSESHVSDQGYALELRGTPVNATTSVSEPGTLALFGIALLGLIAFRKRAVFSKI